MAPEVLTRLSHRLGAYLWIQWTEFVDDVFRLVRGTLVTALKIYLVGLFVGAGVMGTVATVQAVADPQAAPNPWENTRQLLRDLGDLQREIRGLRQDVQEGIEQLQ